MCYLGWAMPFVGLSWVGHVGVAIWVANLGCYLWVGHVGVAIWVAIYGVTLGGPCGRQSGWPISGVILAVCNVGVAILVTICGSIWGGPCGGWPSGLPISGVILGVCNVGGNMCGHLWFDLGWAMCEAIWVANFGCYFGCVQCGGQSV